MPTVQTKAKNFLKQGLDKLNRGNYPGALESFQQALRIDPNFTEAYVCRSIIHYYQGNHQEAIEDCNQVLRINPRNADAYNNRGLNRVALGDYKGAIADFAQALENEPKHVKAYLNRGYSRLQLEDNWGAIEDFDRAMRIDPQAARVYLQQVADTLNTKPGAIKDTHQQLVQGLLVEGNLRYESGDYQEAIEAYTQILRIEPNNSEAYNRRSTARSALGDYEGAYEDLYRATVYYLNEEQSLQATQVPMVQTTVEDYHQRGLEKLKKGDFQGAIEDFNQVLHNSKDGECTLSQRFAIALTCRGFAYQRLGNNQRAFEDLQQAANLFSQQGDVKSSQHILNTLKKLQP
ncbi:MAG: tetratricopeptide repeat protein [Coleofasciculus sp. S288]|nr:tetratricopeptide repeat protein [Coleofasciculus sp. S288]